MSHLITSQALDQDGANLTVGGNLAMSSASTIGIATSLITFNSSAGFIQLGDSSVGGLTFLSANGSGGAVGVIADSNNNEVLEINGGISSPITHFRMTNATGTAAANGPVLSAVSTNSDVNILCQPKGDGAFDIQAQGGASDNLLGLGISGGSSNQYQSRITAPGPSAGTPLGQSQALMLPGANYTSSDVGKVLKISAFTAATTSAPDTLSLELATEAGAGDLTFATNTSTGGAVSVTASDANKSINFTGTRASTITVTLATFAGFTAGNVVELADALGQNATQNLIVNTASVSETINGSTSITLDSNFQVLRFRIINSSKAVII